jgi:diaminopimelate epimerase
MNPQSIPFTKMSGSGNDFIVIDNRDDLLCGVELAALTRHLCQHRISVGADGVILITPPAASNDSVAYTWRYINADGSDGEMCGNGAMCAARFAVRAGIADPHHRFQTASGVIEAWAAAEATETVIAMTDPEPVEQPARITVEGQTLTCTRIVVGVPHIVIVAEDADEFADQSEFDRIGRALRRHDAFAPAGTNVNVVSRIDDQTWRMRTYERGVEAETLACGTGAVASAIVLGHADLAPNPARIRTSSGRDLTVRYEIRDGQAINVRLSGQAAVIYDGTLGPDAAPVQDSSQKTRRNSDES